MRILWLSHFLPYPPTGHGALQRTHQLLVQMARRHEIHLASIVQPGTWADPAPLAPLLASAAAFPIPGGWRRALPAAASLAGGASYWERWFTSGAMRAHVARLVREHAFDVVHVDALFLAGYLDLLGDLPVVLTHHNVESELLRDRAARASGARRRFFARQAARTRALEVALARRAARHVMVSALDAERLHAIAPAARTAVVPNGVDVAYFAPADDAPPPVPHSMVFAGGMDWFPNRDAMQWLAADLWPALVADQPARTMTVIGRNPPAEIQAVAARDARVRVLGFVDDVRPHAAAAAAYLCPIRVGGGTRLKILDALALGRPLVATALSVEGLDLLPDVHYLAAEDGPSFAAQLRRLDEAPALGQALAAAGRRHVEQRFSWDAIADRLDDAYADAAPAARAHQLQA